MQLAISTARERAALGEAGSQGCSIQHAKCKAQQLGPLLLGDGSSECVSLLLAWNRGACFEAAWLS